MAGQAIVCTNKYCRTKSECYICQLNGMTGPAPAGSNVDTSSPTNPAPLQLLGVIHLTCLGISVMKARQLLLSPRAVVAFSLPRSHTHTSMVLLCLQSLSPLALCTCQFTQPAKPLALVKFYLFPRPLVPSWLQPLCPGSSLLALSCFWASSTVLASALLPRP